MTDFRDVYRGHATCIQFGSMGKNSPPPGNIFVVCNCASYRYAVSQKKGATLTMPITLSILAVFRGTASKGRKEGKRKEGREGRSRKRSKGNCVHHLRGVDAPDRLHFCKSKDGIFFQTLASEIFVSCLMLCCVCTFKTCTV